jgi:UDP-N-acetylglucosamine 2-epimerase (non-hydrolysing)
MRTLSSRVAVVLGTRPEIVKLAGVIRLLGDRGYIVHSGQHYDDNLSQAFFGSCRLPYPELQLEVGGRQRGSQFAAILSGLEEAFAQDRPTAVVVQGDTNTATAAALAADFAGIPVVHVEAGLRSYDRAMPEEINRKLIGTVAALHCAPTAGSAQNLLDEGVAAEAIVVTGNTVVEAVAEAMPPLAERLRLVAGHGLNQDAYVLATIHRPENTDDPERLEQVLRALGSLAVPVVLPLHPRTLGKAHELGLAELLDGLQVTQPVDHPTFLSLAQHARLLVSDSGGVQEECTVMKRPLVVVRNSTERPEAIDAGFAFRALPDASLGPTLRAALADVAWLKRVAHIPSPYGDGTASAKIVAAIDALTALAGSPTELVRAVA